MNLKEWTEHLKTRMRAAQNSQMLQLARPNVGPTPAPLRRFVEPVVAAAALSALTVLVLVGLSAAGLLFLAAGLIYGILTHVFGLEFDINPDVVSP